MKKPVSFADYIAQLIEITGKTQREIAQDMGYDRPNLITMFKQGSTKVPIEKVPVLAKSLGVDPAVLLARAMQEYMPETLRVIQQVMGYTVTENEYEIVEAVRSATKKPNPKASKEQISAIRRAFA